MQNSIKCYILHLIPKFTYIRLAKFVLKKEKKKELVHCYYDYVN